ncbi:MAG TPA: class I SAM-dependent methyltransferase [Patescibacteria group bacterium]|nr:class I SAM-dependent methyltransferase [Patescibacteria group bacterium]
MGGDGKNLDNPSVKPEKLPPYSSLKDVGYFRPTRRDLIDYRFIFGFGIQYFKPDSKVVDIGSGERQEFARDLRIHRPDVTVFSVDPSLAIQLDPAQDQQRGIVYELKNRGYYVPDRNARLERRRNAQKFTVAAIAPNLPFPDNSMDYAFDNYGALYYFPVDNDLIKSYFRELYRILKPGGEAQIYPVDSVKELPLSEDLMYKVSKERVVTILSELATELKMSFEPFDFEDTNNRTGDLYPRCGVRIKKPDLKQVST